MSFDRSKPFMSTSLSFQRFRHDATDYSDFYWVSRAERDYLASDLRKRPAAASPVAQYGLQGTPYELRMPPTIAKMSKMVSAVARWQRLTSVILLTSAFERFLQQLAVTAFNSDPLLVPGFPKRVDGLTLRKYNSEVTAPALEELTTGAWSQRISAYRRHFRYVPVELEQAEGPLEQLRLLRNRVAHNFAYAPQGEESIIHVAEGARRQFHSAAQDSIADDKLYEYFLLLGKLTSVIDTDLATRFVGNFEVPALYLDWKADIIQHEKRVGKSTGSIADQGLAARFRAFAGAVLNWSMTTTQAKEMVAFIDGL
jgi:hypothetical protein